MPLEDRNIALELIKEAVSKGARISKVCEALDISVSTFERWRNGNYGDSRKGIIKNNPKKLTPEEVKKIIDISCSDEYKDDKPYKIFASLLDKGIYIASVRSFYRVLKENRLLAHRGNTKPRKPVSAPPELKASGPNQVWCWDITYLKSDIRGIYFYAYAIIDIWDRSIVKWTIHDREDDIFAHNLFQKALKENGNPKVSIHSDNGNPMKGISLLALFQDLGLSNSYSRPRISDDNPFIESFFKTLKYGASFPKFFKSISEARIWFSNFIHYYNNNHQHSGLYFLTPKQVRDGKTYKILKKRNSILMSAKSKNPHRWGKKIMQYPSEHVVFLNPSLETRITMKESEKKAG